MVFKLINNELYLVSDNLAGFDFANVGPFTNIKYAAYSISEQQLYIYMQNLKAYIYYDVPMESVNTLYAPAGSEMANITFNRVWAEQIRGYFRFQEVHDTSIQHTSVSFLLKKYEELKQHEAHTLGLWATDRPDLVQDPDKVLYQIESIKKFPFKGKRIG